MSDDGPLTPMERRLRGEADGLLRSYGDLPPPASIVDRYRRRVRGRARIVGGCAVAATLVFAFLLSQTRPWSPGNGASLVQAPSVAAKGESSADSNLIATVQESDAEPAYPEILSTTQPFFLIEWDADGEPLVTAGFYLAEPEETLNLDDLTPGERYAVQQMLGTAQPDFSIQTL